jgi:hypothetical protein
MLCKFKSTSLDNTFIGSGAELKYFQIDNITEFVQMHSKEICKIYPDDVTFAEITGNGILGAHIDQGPLVALNFYLNAGIDETVFYEKKDNSILNNYVSKVFHFDDLDPKTSFIANTKDIYLLNVSRIHAVFKKTNIPRQFICYHWYNNSFDEIKENLLI